MGSPFRPTVWLTVVALHLAVERATGQMATVGGISADLTSVSFSDSLNGWIGGSLVLLHTADGGVTWNVPDAAPKAPIRFVLSPTRSCVWLTYCHCLARSSNGGVTWDTLDDDPGGHNTYFYYTRVAALDSQRAWLVGAVSGAFFGGPTPIARTIDGGKTLLPANLHLETSALWYAYTAISAVSDSVAFALFNRKTICQTFDAGNAWRLHTMESPFNDLKMVSAGMVWIVGDSGRIACTKDSGATWIAQSSPTNRNLRSLSVIDSVTAWVVGEHGTILRTENSGHTWISVHSPTTLTLSSVDFTDREHGWMVGDSGVVLRYIDENVVLSVESRLLHSPELSGLSVFPNPFNPGTTITVSVARSTAAVIRVYDLVGRELELLFSGDLQPGTHSFPWVPRAFSSGVYFVRVAANGRVLTEKAVLVH